MGKIRKGEWEFDIAAGIGLIWEYIRINYRGIPQLKEILEENYRIQSSSVGKYSLVPTGLVRSEKKVSIGLRTQVMNVELQFC